MSSPKIIINGHYRHQLVTGVQRYAHEIVSRFNQHKVAYHWSQPPQWMESAACRQIWMQGVMPFKIPKDTVLWSPTNIGPIYCENQVITLHDISDQRHPEWFDKKYVAWRKFILPKLLQRVRKIITVSKFSKQTILAHFPQAKGKIDVIYNGVRTDCFYPRNQREIKAFRKQFNIQKPFILSVGSLDPRKNVGCLIKAFQKLPSRIQDEMKLVITGAADPKFIYDKNDIKDHKNIRFTGYISDDQLPVLYSAAELFVYPSLFEGFGLPVLEAMACGTPVVTSNTTALRELAEGKAYTVDPENSDAIANAIKQVIDEDLGNYYTSLGLKYVQNFSWDRAANETLEILKQAY